MPLTGIDRLVDIAFGVAVGWLLAIARSRFRAAPEQSEDAGTDTVTAASIDVELVASAAPGAPAERGGFAEPSQRQQLTTLISGDEAIRGSSRAGVPHDAAPHAAARSEDIERHADALVPSGEAAERVTRSPAAVLGLAPPPLPESETPAHRVLRLGDAPESPIHSQSPDDWEDLPMPSGEVWLAPKGCQEIAARASAAFHVRRTFRRVK